MSMRLYWDKEAKEIRAYDPQELTAQERGNIVLLQGIINNEYRRGYERGYAVAYGLFAGDGRSKRPEVPFRYE